MNANTVKAFGIVLLVNHLAFADASYESTSRISGGALTDTLKSNPFAAKATQQMLAPTSTLTMVHGNQKAVVNKDSTQIVDLDKETITHIDTAKKTYSVMTFEQMRQAMAAMPQRMEQAQAQMNQAQAQMKQAQSQLPKTDLKTSFEVSVKNTGVTKVVNGLSAQEQVITMQMHVTDPNAPASGAGNSMAFEVTTDVWIAPDPPEVQEVHDFDMRMGKKMTEGMDMSAFTNALAGNAAAGNAGLAQLLGGQPGSAEALAQMGKEMAKLQGTHVKEVTSMGGSGPAAAQNSAPSTPAAAPAASGGSVVGQVATDTATQTAAGESSKMGVPGSALASSVLGALRKKKAAPAPAPPPAAAAAPAPAGTPATVSAVLMEMTREETNFSREAIPLSVFQAPSGFTKVPSPLERMGK
jgi:hypothetical protein